MDLNECEHFLGQSVNRKTVDLSEMAVWTRTVGNMQALHLIQFKGKLSWAAHAFK